MNTTEIQERLNAMAPRMSAKGKVDPETRLSFAANSQPFLSISWQKTDGSTGYNRAHISFRVDAGIVDALNAADNAITDMPSIEEARVAEFTEKLAAVIELGNQHGIDVQFVNPLIEAMKRLSENAIEDHSA